MLSEFSDSSWPVEYTSISNGPRCTLVVRASTSVFDLGIRKNASKTIVMTIMVISQDFLFMVENCLIRTGSI